MRLIEEPHLLDFIHRNIFKDYVELNFLFDFRMERMSSTQDGIKRHSLLILEHLPFLYIFISFSQFWVFLSTLSKFTQ